jgi:hypothetical protein
LTGNFRTAIKSYIESLRAELAHPERAEESERHSRVQLLGEILSV